MKNAVAAARRLAGYVSKFPGKRIAVLGDFMLDQFVWGRASRLSAEAPVPVVEVTHETAAPGGAGNVVANIAALGGEAAPFGIVGRDAAAGRLRRILEALGADTGGLLGAPGRQTTVKTRVIETARKHQVARTDRESREPMPRVLLRRLARQLLNDCRRFDAVVVSDYEKGTVTPELLADVLPELQKAGLPVFLDPRTRHPLSYRPITVITPNEGEAERISGIRIDSDEALAEAGQKLLEMLGCPYVLITRGERGMALFERDGGMRTIATMAREVYDVTGAGDTVIAALALAYAAGATMHQAASIANCAAGRAVAHVGTSAPAAQEVRAALLDGARSLPDHTAWQLQTPGMRHRGPSTPRRRAEKTTPRHQAQKNTK